MQLMPATAKRFGVENPYDPDEALDGGCQYLAWLRDRQPELRVISVEAYNGWLPFVAEYGDHAYRVHRYWNDVGLAEPPSFYLRRQVYATFIEDPVGLRERHAFGVDNIMWSSDYPHGESTFPDSPASWSARSPGFLGEAGRSSTRTRTASITCEGSPARPAVRGRAPGGQATLDASPAAARDDAAGGRR
jgi:hypothetical protein